MSKQTLKLKGATLLRVLFERLVSASGNTNCTRCHNGMNRFHLHHTQEGIFPRAGNHLNSARPATAEKTDAMKIPSLALSIRLSLKAIFAINSAMVKPIPASKLPPINNLQVSSGGRIAKCKRIAS